MADSASSDLRLMGDILIPDGRNNGFVSATGNNCSETVNAKAINPIVRAGHGTPPVVGVQFTIHNIENFHPAMRHHASDAKQTLDA